MESDDRTGGHHGTNDVIVRAGTAAVSKHGRGGHQPNTERDTHNLSQHGLPSVAGRARCWGDRSPPCPVDLPHNAHHAECPCSRSRLRNCRAARTSAITKPTMKIEQAADAQTQRAIGVKEDGLEDGQQDAAQSQSGGNHARQQHDPGHGPPAHPAADGPGRGIKQIHDGTEDGIRDRQKVGDARFLEDSVAAISEERLPDDRDDAQLVQPQVGRDAKAASAPAPGPVTAPTSSKGYSSIQGVYPVRPCGNSAFGGHCAALPAWRNRGSGKRLKQPRPADRPGRDSYSLREKNRSPNRS